MSRIALLSITLAALAGCTANIPDGRFRCDTVTPCPSGLTCTGGLCYHPGVGPDGGVPPGDGGDGGGPSDTGADAPLPSCATGADCITLTVTNAYGDDVSAISFEVEGTDFALPAYGETTDEFMVALGGDAMLDLYTTQSESLSASAGQSYALVVGHNPDETQGAPVVRLLSNSVVAPGAGEFHARFIDMIQDGDDLQLTDTMMMTPRGISPGTDPGVILCTSGARYPLVLSRANGAAGNPGATLAVFDTLDLPQTGSHYVVLVGRTSQHLASPDGLRAIPVVAGITSIVRSHLIAYVLNTTGTKMQVCAGTRLIATVESDRLVGGFPSFTPDTAAGVGGAITLHDATALAGCDGPSRDLTLPYAATADDTGRVLVAIAGNPASSAWGAGASIEARPATSSPEQTITYGNGSPAISMNFGSTAMPARANAPALGTATVEWASRPTDLRIEFGATVQTFDWAPSATTAAIIATAEGTVYTAYEMDSPFGQSWTLTVTPPQ